MPYGVHARRVTHSSRAVPLGGRHHELTTEQVTPRGGVDPQAITGRMSLRGASAKPAPAPTGACVPSEIAPRWLMRQSSRTTRRLTGRAVVVVGTLIGFVFTSLYLFAGAGEAVVWAGDTSDPASEMGWLGAQGVYGGGVKGT